MFQKVALYSCTMSELNILFVLTVCKFVLKILTYIPYL